MALTNSSRKRRWCISISAVVIILIIIAIVVPLAVILPKRGHHKSAIILPLYIYPQTNNTWRPLYDAVEAHPQLEFIVIVNPSSGPGSSPYPDDKYTPQVEQLNGYPNVKTVGYVRTGYATRNITNVTAEVSTYAGWASKSNSLVMHGVFFDEAPSQYSAAAVEYMRTIDQAVKDANGLQGNRTVIHNPGTIPDSRYNDTNTDITVVFEDSYSAYQTKWASIAALPKRRSEYSIMIHSVPIMSPSNLHQLVNRLSGPAEFLFITENTQDYYESFGSQWANFTNVVPT